MTQIYFIWNVSSFDLHLCITVSYSSSVAFKNQEELCRPSPAGDICCFPASCCIPLGSLSVWHVIRLLKLPSWLASLMHIMSTHFKPTLNSLSVTCVSAACSLFYLSLTVKVGLPHCLSGLLPSVWLYILLPSFSVHVPVHPLHLSGGISVHY